MIKQLWARDKQFWQWIRRQVIYPYFRFEHHRLKDTCEKMESMKMVDKEEMKASKGEWKWMYVVKDPNDQKYRRRW